MSRTASPTAQDFVPFATAALDFHRALNIPSGPLVTSRAELDALHAHLVSLYGLLDAHAARTCQLVAAEGDQLRTARIRIWQAAEHLHAAYHAAPRPGTGELPEPEPEACRVGLPEGAPELTICQRHQRTARLVRRRTTPVDLHAPFTGLVRR
ncbi:MULTISPECIES: DUF6238 family protein [Streptomyces]|uniref:DUF6238 family protein n=1 Tax=Streptomyces TaxID=1883 RepID=UPI001370B685|nr:MULTISPECIES: DUF6238 family protein [unclassified Streptomyces]MDX2623080.1 DUF6238 family protein [Streptomyces sp. WI03-5b]MYT59016.1 hypothetical protein [Streptomyces sp. SID7834]WSR09852.1 DUF6238 family protein [Streptomyces sp. NBC_01208]WSR47424.1 DUF6238 family protein [Streptomyces sp. NBC_01201]